MPQENIATVDTQWTEGNIDTVDVFEDIQGIVDAAQEKVTFDRILLDQKRLSYILRSKKMKQVIFGTDKSSSPLLLANLNEFMRSNGLPVFEVIRRMTRIQDNGKIREYKPWNDKSLVFVPEGRLGVIKTPTQTTSFAPSRELPTPTTDASASRSGAKARRITRTAWSSRRRNPSLCPSLPKSTVFTR